MTPKEQFKNMYNFWKAGNSLEALLQWIRDVHSESSAIAIMTGFMNEYKKDTKLREEFDKSCFITNTHKI